MKKAIVSGSAAMLVLGVGTWLFWPAPFPIRAYERIRLGMTASEVEAVIGEAPSNRTWALLADPGPLGISGLGGGVVRRTGVPFVIFFGEEFEVRKEFTADGWLWPEYSIWVICDLDGKVIGYELFDSDVASPSCFDRIWDWLRSWGPPPTTTMKAAPRPPGATPK